VEVCEALQQQPTAQGLTVLREYCLERRRSQLRELTALLAQGADPGLLSKAVQASQSLPPLADCAEAKALTEAVPPPEDPTLRAQVKALDQQADKLYVLLVAGKYKEGLALGGQLLGQAEPLGYAFAEGVGRGALARGAGCERCPRGRAPGLRAIGRGALARRAGANGLCGGDRVRGGLARRLGCER
jgi:serine/threonine-protein kinase